MELLTIQEQIIMMQVWRNGEDISLGELIDVVSSAKECTYNRNTISTYVRRLNQKGYLTTYHKGKCCYIHATPNLEGMIQKQIRWLAVEFYDGDIQRVKRIVENMQ
jgi:predicted transcriptional regulator